MKEARIALLRPWLFVICGNVIAEFRNDQKIVQPGSLILYKGAQGMLPRQAVLGKRLVREVSKNEKWYHFTLLANL